MTAAESQDVLWWYLVVRMDLIKVLTGIFPYWVTESNHNLCLGGGALNYEVTPNFKR